MRRKQIIDTAIVYGLIQALGPFAELNSRLPLRCVQAFLQIGLKEGESVAYYAAQLGVSPNTMSRNLLDISPRNRYLKDGYGLVQSRRKRNDMRTVEYFLSDKGRALLSSTLKQIRPAA
jgi:DNA-binding MarR family transcriptional regulator